jgi:hypothetical protein
MVFRVFCVAVQLIINPRLCAITIGLNSYCFAPMPRQVGPTAILDNIADPRFVVEFRNRCIIDRVVVHSYHGLS